MQTQIPNQIQIPGHNGEPRDHVLQKQVVLLEWANLFIPPVLVGINCVAMEKNSGISNSIWEEFLSWLSSEKFYSLRPCDEIGKAWALGSLLPSDSTLWTSGSLPVSKHQNSKTSSQVVRRVTWSKLDENTQSHTCSCIDWGSPRKTEPIGPIDL